jgi:GDP-fucose protein O-fucosyltransferase
MLSLESAEQLHSCYSNLILNVNRCVPLCRMAFESVLIFASITGRTLVMPPKKRMYLLSERQEVEFSDFFPMEGLNSRMSIISTAEFFKREALKGGLPVEPPGPPDTMSFQNVMDYYKAAAGRTEGGLPKLNPGDQGIVFPFVAGEPIDMVNDPRYVLLQLLKCLLLKYMLACSIHLQGITTVQWQLCAVRCVIMRDLALSDCGSSIVLLWSQQQHVTTTCSSCVLWHSCVYTLLLPLLRLTHFLTVPTFT